MPLSSGRLVPASRVCQDRDINALEQTCVNSTLIRRPRHPVGLTPKGNLDPERGCLVCTVGYLQAEEDMGPSGVSRSLVKQEKGPGQGQAAEGRGRRRPGDLSPGPTAVLACKTQMTHPAPATCINPCGRAPDGWAPKPFSSADQIPA